MRQSLFVVILSAAVLLVFAGDDDDLPKETVTFSPSKASKGTVAILAASITYALPEISSALEIKILLALGYTVEVVSSSDWLKKTTPEDFKRYSAIVVSDNGADFDEIDFATQNIAAWGSATAGNNVIIIDADVLPRAVIGLNPDSKRHFRTVISKSLKFVTAQGAGRPGAYLSLGRRPVDVKKRLTKPYGDFTITNAWKTERRESIDARFRPSGDSSFTDITDADIIQW